MLTIGELAKRVGLRTSALRYYEKEGLLSPDTRSDAGYRLYGETAVTRLQLIQRAQRLGFSLADIRTLLRGWDAGDLDDATLLHTAEQRYLTLARQITELMVQQHELELFLQDLRQRQAQDDGGAARSAFDDLLARVCANPLPHPPANTLLSWLVQYTNCVLNTRAGRNILDRLRGQHVHVWQESDDAYHILVVSEETAVRQALYDLAQLESNCQVHDHPAPELIYDDEGYRLVVRGENAFIFVRLFLALEQEGVEGQGGGGAKEQG